MNYPTKHSHILQQELEISENPNKFGTRALTDTLLIAYRNEEAINCYYFDSEKKPIMVIEWRPFPEHVPADAEVEPLIQWYLRECAEPQRTVLTASLIAFYGHLKKARATVNAYFCGKFLVLEVGFKEARNVRIKVWPHCGQP